MFRARHPARDWKTLSFPPPTPRFENQYQEALHLCSTQVKYTPDGDQRVVVQGGPMFKHDPYAPVDYELLFKVIGLSFCRSGWAEADLRVLFNYISEEIIPLHSGFAPSGLYCKVKGMPQKIDNSFRRDGMPSKVRHVVIQTNYVHLDKLLSDERLLILADSNCFHVCWNGKKVAFKEESGDGEWHTNCFFHDAENMRSFIKELRDMIPEERHQATGGLPCDAIKFQNLGNSKPPQTNITQFHFW